jgi:hypothetical protein
VQSIRTADLSIEDTFKRTLKGVYQETRGEQTPWLSSSFFGDFVFRPRSLPASAVADTSQAIIRDEAPKQLAKLAGIYRETGTNPNGTKYVGMATVVPRGDRARFTWWVAKDRFRGTAELAGKMLVVNWNQKHPVIYTFNRQGVLEGEWADGSATDRLELFTSVDSAPAPLPQGQYRVEGKNPDGTPYSGTTRVTRRGDEFHLAWKTGETSYSGTGFRDGNVLTVNWGGAMPIVYALNADGTLTGLWDAGRAHETLTPLR